jgi:hypothetical protein
MVRLMRIGKDKRDVVAKTFADHAAVLAALAARDRLAFQYQMSRHLDIGLGLIEERDASGSRDSGDPDESPAGGRRRRRSQGEAAPGT